ncbi:MAG: hypothetical protein KBC56_08985 [Flavobacterium sp.]|nr:hypothetical protein [Flavobacterium sp.]
MDYKKALQQAVSQHNLLGQDSKKINFMITVDEVEKKITTRIEGNRRILKNEYLFQNESVEEAENLECRNVITQLLTLLND